jgi:hypothetical protein
VRKTISELECVILTTLFIAGAKKHQHLMRQEGGFAMCFSSRRSNDSIVSAHHRYLQ